MTQLDLFGVEKPRAAKRQRPAEVQRSAVQRFATLADIRPPRCAEWEKMLADHAISPATVTVQIIVSALWTGVVVEELVHPAVGRKHLHATGQVADYPGRDSETYLTVFMTADEALAVHVRTPLLQLGAAGTESVRFGVADPGDETPVLLQFPKGL